MTEFSLQNKAYDLLINLKEDGIIKDPPSKFESIGDVRLAFDLVKSIYPMYANADNDTISNFVKDMFNVNLTSTEIEKANHKNEEYRFVEPQDIIPGNTFKIIENTYEYFHTFWVYEDTNKIIPPKDTTVEGYNRAYMSIWNKAKQGKAFIKNVYKHRIGDTVSMKNDPNSIGIVKSRLCKYKPTPITNPYIVIPNQYSVTWYNLGDNKEIPLTHWISEDSLINITRLEALPMKTEIMKHTRNKKVLVTLKYKVFNPKEWIEENVRNGYDREVYNKLAFSESNAKFKTHGWIEEERNIIIGKHQDINKTIRNDYRINKENLYKDIEIISTRIIEKDKNPTYTVKKKNPNYTKNIKPVSIHNDEKLVCVKHFDTGLVRRMKYKKSIEIVKHTDKYGYVSKSEWRKCRNEISANGKKLGLKEERVKKDPVYTKMGTEEIINPKTGQPEIISLPRRSRRSDKHKVKRGSRLVKEQFIKVQIPEEKVTVKGISPTTWYYDKEGKFIGSDFFESTFIRPARIAIKRILTRIKPNRPVKVTEEIKEQRLEQSKLDKQVYLNKKGYKSLDELKQEFASDERRNDKFSLVEKWSTTFNNLQKLILEHKLFKDGVHVANVNPKALPEVINVELQSNGRTKWSKEKVNNFIRYIRLTTHGIFSEKPKKIKKQKQSIEFEPTKFITRIDFSKLKHNLPEENKVIYVKFTDASGEIEKVGMFKDGDIYLPTGEFLCQMRDVIAWKYKKKDEYQDIIVNEGEAIKQVPIKFRRKDPEHLTRYFARMKKHKEYKNGRKSNKTTK